MFLLRLGWVRLSRTVTESFHNLKSETLNILPTPGTTKTGQQTPKVCGLFGLTVKRKAMRSFAAD